MIIVSWQNWAVLQQLKVTGIKLLPTFKLDTAMHLQESRSGLRESATSSISKRNPHQEESIDYLLYARVLKTQFTLWPERALALTCSIPISLAYLSASSNWTVLFGISHLFPAIIIGASFGIYFLRRHCTAFNTLVTIRPDYSKEYSGFVFF